MKKFLFFLRAYNDFDHLAPLIWKCLEKGDEPVILLTTNFKIEDDYRFKLINQDKNVRIIYDVDKVFEKHFTLSHKTYGPDHACSMVPTQLKELVKFKNDLKKCI